MAEIILVIRAIMIVIMIKTRVNFDDNTEF